MVMKPTNPMAMEEGVPAAVPDSVSLDLPQSIETLITCLLYTSPSPRDKRQSRMPSSA